MNEKIFLTAKAKREEHTLGEVLDKFGIVHPHPSLGFFRFIYSPVESANLNKVILAEKAVDESIAQLRATQVNINHERLSGHGSIVSAWVNKNEEIEIVISFFKNLFPKEYEYALDLYNEDKLFVSFELSTNKDSVEIMPNGDRRVHEISWEGVGLLMDVAPAYPGARALETAMYKIEQVLNQDSRELVFASAKEISKHWTKIGEMLETVLTDKEFKKATTQYSCECLSCGKVITSSNHCKDEKCPECGGEMRRKNRPGSGDKASLDINLLKTEKSSKEEIKVNEKTKNALLAKFKEDVTKELGEAKVKDWSDEQWVAELERRAEVEKSDQEKAEAKKLEDEKAKVDAEKAKKDEELSKKKIDAKKSVLVTEEKLITTETYDDESGEYKTDRVGTRVVTDNGKVTVDEKFDNSVIYSFAQVEEIKAEYEKQLKEKDEVIASKDDAISAKEKVVESAKQIIETRQDLGEFAKDLSDEDLLDESKVEEAKLKKENSEKVEKAKEELKDNEFAKDFSDEDYLNEDKKENAKLRKEVEDLKAKKESLIAKTKKEEKLELDASTNDEDKELKIAARKKYMKNATGQK